MICVPEGSAPRSILVVEDEGITAWDIEQSLVELGFQVVGIAATGADAVRQARERCPDLVLMDVRLQGDVDGIEAAGQIRRELDVPVVYLTSHGDRETLDRAKVTEPLAYLLKPFRRGELQSVLEIALHRHAVERRLRERERLLATTLQALDEAVVTVDVHGRITSTNPQFDRIVGRSAPAGVPLTDALDLRAEWSDDRVPLERSDGAHAPAQRTARLIAADGAVRFVAVTVSAVSDGAEILGSVVVLRDQTEERRVQHQLEVADRLSTFGLMASAVAHEINNPLAYVLGNLQYGIEQLARWPVVGAPPRDVDDALREAVDGCDRIGRIVRDLRSFNRAEPGAEVSVDVHRVLGWALDVTRQVSTGHADIVAEYGTVPLVRADETRLGQVFVNLLTNAVQSLRPDGPRRVSVTTRPTVEGDVQIEVSDSGAGMSPLVLGRIFEPFFTTKPPGIGTGLGLAVCRAIVRSVGGHLEAESTLGVGSTFRVVLPAARRGARTTPPQPTSTAEVVARGRVLIVDDDRALLGLLTRTLRHQHEVTAEASPRAALARLAAGERFDVVLCDALMPEMSGLTVYGEILRTWPALAERFVLVTGGVTLEEAAHAGSPIPPHRLLKPFDPARLRSLVARLVTS